jgi:CRISPR type III-A-associated protein Csm2
MADTPEIEQEPRAAEAQSAPAAVEAPPVQRPERKAAPQGDRPQGDRPPGGRGPQGQGREGGGQRREGGPGQGNREGRGGPQSGREGGRDRGDDRRGGDRGRFEGPPEIDIEKLISDPLYLDNQAHGVVSRMRDMDSGTKSQLRRLYNAVRRAVRTPENERQQQFVMLRARLAYTIARHSLRSLDPLEKLLLQVTRKNEARGYERFRDLFEAIVAYNE